MCRFFYLSSGLATVLAFCAWPAAADVALELGGGVARNAGFLQTPTGGQPGTSSAKRPTFAELAMRRGDYGWLAAAVDFGRLRVHARYAVIGSAGASRLTSALTSQGFGFRAGERVRSTASFDSLSVAVTRVFAWREDVTAELGGELAWTAFDLGIRGDDALVDRSYHVHTVGFFAAIAKRLGPRWRLGATLGLAPGVEAAGSRYRVAPRLELHLSERWRLALGLDVEQFRYDDAHKQELPNRLLVRRRVLPTLSIGTRF